MNLIAITGKARSGKDTIAKYLCEKYAKVYTEPFAKPLKLACAAAFGIPIEDFMDTETKELDNDAWGVSPRKIAQFVGTEMFRDTLSKLIPEIGTEFWVARMAYLLQGHILTEEGGQYDLSDTIVIPDLRFQNEYDMVCDWDGYVFHVIKEGIGEVGIEGHVSEAGIVTNADNTWLINNNGTLEELYEEVERALTVFNIPLFINTLVPRI